MDEYFMFKIKINYRKFLTFFRWYISIDFAKSPSVIPSNLYIGKNVRIYPRSHIKIGINVFIGDDSRITTNTSNQSNINIGNDVLIADRVNIIGGAHEYSKRDIPIARQGEGKQNPIVIESDCWLCSNTVITSGAILPKGSILAAMSLLNKKMIQNYSLYAGIPAKFIKICR